MDRDEINEIIGGGADIVLRDLAESYGQASKDEFLEEDEGLGDRWSSGRSSTATVISPGRKPDDKGCDPYEDDDETPTGIRKEGNAYIEKPKTHLGAWKDLALVYAIVRTASSLLKTTEWVLTLSTCIEPSTGIPRHRHCDRATCCPQALPNQSS